jgi:peptide-methionine (S)-S-oxide reductase
MRAWSWAALVVVGFIAVSVGGSLIKAYSKQAVHLPAPAIDVTPAPGAQTVVFAGGCFWCTEAVFEELKGVTSVVSGYAGGSESSAKYDLVSGGGTQHAESIQITYDPREITYGQLLQVFFSVAHDPTQLNRQGPDSGYQYRSAIFYTTEEQRRVAEAYVAQLGRAKVFPAPIVTKIVPLPAFYSAEEYHQNFVRQHPHHPYVIVNAIPKLKKLRQQFPNLIRHD